MNTRAILIVLTVTTCAAGCHDAARQLKMRRMTVDLLRSISDMERQMVTEKDSLRYLDALGKSIKNQQAIIDSTSKRLAELRSDVLKYSDCDPESLSESQNYHVDQLHYERLNHQKLSDRLKKISSDHEKALTRAKES